VNCTEFMGARIVADDRESIDRPTRGRGETDHESSARSRATLAAPGELATARLALFSPDSARRARALQSLPAGVRYEMPQDSQARPALSTP